MSYYRQLIDNFISLAVLRGLDIIIPIIMLPYLIKTLGMEHFGLVVFSTSFALFFGVIIQYGFSITATREISRSRKDLSKLSKIYSSTIHASLYLSLISVFLFSLIVVVFNKFHDHISLYFYSLVSVALKSLFPVWFFQGVEKMRFITLFSLSTKILYLITVLIFVKNNSDYYLVPLLNSIAAFISLIGALLVINYKFNVNLYNVDFSSVKKMLIKGRSVFLYQLSPNFYNNMSVFLLGVYANHDVVGYYSAATTIIAAFISLSYIFSKAFFPYLAINMDIFIYFQRVMFVLGVLTTVFVNIFSNEIVMALFSTIDGAPIIVKYVQYLSISIFFIFMTQTYLTNYLLLTNKDSVARNISISVSLLFLFLSFIIIPDYHAVGAILIVVSARLSLSACSYLFYKKHSFKKKI